MCSGFCLDVIGEHCICMILTPILYWRWYEWHKQSSKDQEDDFESDSESDSQSDSEASVDSNSDPDYTYSGHAIVFPLKVKCRLHWSPPGFCRNSDGTYSPQARTFIEMLRVQIVKKNC